MIRTTHPNQDIYESDLHILEGITHYVSAVLAKNHFAVLVYDLNAHSVMVYDEPEYPLKTWEKHNSHTLRNYEL